MSSVLSPETAWRIHDDAESALLIDGRDYYRAFYAAVSRATRSILLLGWQFDSDVELLRGDDLPEGMAPSDVELLPLLGRLCRERPELQVRILAWDHSVVFAFEREVLQKLHFETAARDESRAPASERFRFCWDATVPYGGSHHQKVAIVDGAVAFLGSQDICQSRWDDSDHRPHNAHRHVRGTSHPPYHEVQVAVAGDAARSLLDLFVARWTWATGEALDRARLVAPAGSIALDDLPTSLPMPRARFGLARTIPAVPGRSPVQEVLALFVRAIARAERLVYVETQYLTSRAVRDALIARMRDTSRPPLDVVILLPERPEKLKEELTIGAAQALSLRALGEAARTYGHALGVYHALAGGSGDGEEVYVYIHSKLVIVDDDLFVVGSANLTNRSMTIDSEIVAVYEARPEDHRLRGAILRARTRLLGEHVGADLPGGGAPPPRGLVACLDAIAATPGGRLRKHDPALLEPSLLARAVHGLAADVLDPSDGGGGGHDHLPAA